MKKETLKKLKTLLLAITICIILNSCSKETDEPAKDKEAIVIFVEGKALIYNGDYYKYIGEEYIGLGGSVVMSDEITRFSPGTQAVEVKNIEDAIELATAIVGEENIIYIDYKGEDMELNYTKKK